MNNDTFIEQLFLALTDLRGEMRVSRASYQVVKKLLIDYFRASAFGSESGGPINFGPFGSLQLGYRRMGAIDSVDLFGIDELLVFAYYWANRRRYRRTLDLGANLGLHSIIMSRCGYEVTAFEPDPVHQELLLANLAANNINNVKLERAAVSDTDGEAEFVRVVGNTTGSHLAGAKASPYGELNRFSVKVRNIAPFAAAADFAKIDVEGHEMVVLNAIPKNCWASFDALLEVGSLSNAEGVLAYSRAQGLNIFAQKTGWGKVVYVDDIPTSHREGSIVLSRNVDFPWG